VCTHHRRTQLERAVSELAERDRTIVRLRFVEGWTQRQIREHVGVTQMQISRVLTRIIADLRRAITDGAA
jgi:RNA polymerase sigma-B factor